MTDEELTNAIERMTPIIVGAVMDEVSKRMGAVLNDEWYSPREVSEMTDGRVSDEAVRNWVRWDQIDGESTPSGVRIYRATVEELRSNKWRALREPDQTKLPYSKANAEEKVRRDNLKSQQTSAA